VAPFSFFDQLDANTYYSVDARGAFQHVRDDKLRPSCKSPPPLSFSNTLNLIAKQRDHVVGWFNSGNNYAFVEILPEETLRIASIIRAPVLAFAAFRILVNEHAITIAAGDVYRQARKNTTVFGRRQSGCISGTEKLDLVTRMVEHAGVAMAERYKQAIDDICGPNALAILDVPEWNELTSLDLVIPGDLSLPVRSTYDALLDEIRTVIHRTVMKFVDNPQTQLPNVATASKFFSEAAKLRWIASETGLSYLVSKQDLRASFSLPMVYTRLNKYQRALCPFLWLELRDLPVDDLVGTQDAYGAALAFSQAFQHAKNNNVLLPRPGPDVPDEYSLGFFKLLFNHAVSSLSAYAVSFSARDTDFGYSITQHMVLSLSQKEMDYLKWDEAVFETDIPEAELGPTGPGPAFHTGITVPSESDSLVDAMDGTDIRSDCDTSTVVGSAVAQDGISTVHDRNRVLTLSSSLASEGFTDDALSADVAEAETAVPALHQPLGQALAAYVEAEQEDVDDGAESVDWEFEYDYGSEFSDEEGDFDDDDDDDDDMEVVTHKEAQAADQQQQKS
jgi:hypothetical protein